MSSTTQLRASRARTMGLALTVGALVLGYGGTAALAQSSSPAAMGAVTTVNATTTDLGTFLTDADGKTLYFFTKDTVPGASVCTEGCLDNWPILAVAADGSVAGGEGVTGVLGAFPRADGTLQASYDGRPLYYFAADAVAGDVNGQGAGDVWYVAQVDGSVPPAPAASDAPTGAVTTVNATTTELGTFLTDADGKTLYYFTKDTVPGASVCTEGCLDNWPILAVAADGSIAGGEGVTGVLGAFPRADGTLQASYDGRPLYYFAADAAAGDVNGQGKGGVWFVAAVDGSVPAAPAASATP